MPPSHQTVQRRGDDVCEIADYVLKSQVKSHNIKILNIFSARREDEWRDLQAILSL